MEAPPHSYTATNIISAYNTIARSRRYEQGIPLSLDIASINAFCEQYDLPVERWIFNDCIFALDNLFLEESHKKAEQRNKQIMNKPT